MKENIEFSENAIKDAKKSLKDESAAVKRLQKQLNDERAQRVKISEECCSLKIDLQEMKTQLQRSRALTILPEKKAELRSEGAAGAEVEKLDQKQEDRDTVPVNAVKDQQVCIFEFRKEGSCLRKEKCKFVHKIPASMREDEEVSKQMMISTSERIGKCAYEMTQRGSCVNKSCRFAHGKGGRVQAPREKRICFKELVEEGSCHWKSQCRFSHQISQEQRRDVDFLESQLKEKDERASKCLNEYRKKGSCLRKDKCPFSHKINEEDRQNEETKSRMQERQAVLKKRKDLGSAEMEKKQSGGTYLEEIMAMRKEMKDEMRELREIKDMMINQRRP